jgi:hypothetical protein
MVFSNIQAVQRGKFILIRIPLIITLIILVLQVFEILQIPYLLIISASTTLLALISTLVFRLFFVEVELNETGVSIKYYHLFPLVREFQKIEITKGQLSDLEYSESFGGLVGVMKISVLTNRGRATYPDVPLTLFKKPKREIIVNQIEKWL